MIPERVLSSTILFMVRRNIVRRRGVRQNKAERCFWAGCAFLWTGCASWIPGRHRRSQIDVTVQEQYRIQYHYPLRVGSNPQTAIHKSSFPPLVQVRMSLRYSVEDCSIFQIKTVPVQHHYIYNKYLQASKSLRYSVGLQYLKESVPVQDHYYNKFLYYYC